MDRVGCIDWQLPPKGLTLTPQAIHIWCASLTQASDIFLNVLTSEERQRGERFAQEKHRRRFCQARAFLRLILARYLLMPAENIQFREGAHGKLAITEQRASLQFNLSHSQDLALYAITLNREVGIDIEWIDPAFAAQPLIARFFPLDEQSSLLALPINRQNVEFYWAWTRKEAYLKALGVGLSGLSTMAVTEEEKALTMNLTAAPGYAAALALTAPNHLGSINLSYFLADVDSLLTEGGD